MRNRTVGLICLICLICYTVFSISLIGLKAISYNSSFIESIKNYEQNIVDYANGDDWFSRSNEELGDAGAYDESYVEPELDNNDILEPLGKSNSERFSYYKDLESDNYIQVYEDDKAIYFIHWKNNDLSMPCLIDSFSK